MIIKLIILWIVISIPVALFLGRLCGLNDRRSK